MQDDAGRGLPSRLTLTALAALSVPLTSAALPVAVYLPPFYAERVGLGLVGLVFMLTRVWDAVSDPLIGLLSDRTATRFGRRKPWIAAGAPVFILATAAIFAPGLFGVRPSLVWLAAWLSIFYLGLTMVQIPYWAWAGELADRYHQRSRVQSFQTVAGAAGLLLVLVLPALLDRIGAATGHPPAAADKLALMGGFVILAFIPSVVLALACVKEPAATVRPPVRPSLAKDLKAMARDHLLLRVLASDFAVTLGQLIRSSLFVFFVSAYVGRPDLAAGLFLLQFVFGLFAAPIWLRVGYRFGKHLAAVAGELTQAAINIGLLAVEPNALPLLAALSIAQGLAQGSGNLMLRAMVADLADRQRLESGRERTGLLFSVFSLTGKAATAVAVGLALPMVGHLGFHPGAANPPAVLERLKLIFALGPALAHLASAALIHNFPLDEARHADIRRRLDLRDRAAAVPAE